MVAIALAFPVQASEASLVVARRPSVYVKDASTNAAIPGASVYLDGSYAGTADSSGAFAIQSASASLQLTVEMEGYNVYQTTVDATGVRVLTVYLKQSSVVLIVATDGSGDYSSIQQAIDALPAQGGEIQAKDGTYHEAISIQKSNVALRAIGTNVIVRVDKASTNGILVGNSQQGQSGVLIEGLHIIGEGTPTWDDGRGIWIYKSAHSIISRVRVENMGSSGVSMREATSITVEDSEISNCRMHGVELYGSSDNLIVRTLSHDNGLTNFMVYSPSSTLSSQRNKFVACVSRNPYDNGFYVDVGSDENEITGSRSEDATNVYDGARGGSGIMVKSNRNIIADNTITHCRVGIQLTEGASYNHILRNTVTRSVAVIDGSGTGILINDSTKTDSPCTSNEISGNRTQDNERDGIEMGTRAQVNSITDCVMNNNARHDLTIYGSGNSGTRNIYSTSYIADASNMIDPPLPLS